MKHVERAVITLFILVMLFCGHQLIGVLVAQHKWLRLDASAWASWTQAVGSIAAIIGAFWISAQQHRRERALEAERRAEEEKKKLGIVRAVLVRIESRFRPVIATRQGRNFSVSEEVYLSKLRATASVLDGLPPYEMPDPQLLLGCFSLSSHIADLCDALDENRDALVNCQAPPRPIAEIDAEIAKISSLISDGIGICDNKLSVEP